MVVACIALAISLGGTSYAAMTLPRNSVGTSQLKRNAVTSQKVKNNSIGGADVNEASLGTVPSAANATAAPAPPTRTSSTTSTPAASCARAPRKRGTRSVLLASRRSRTAGQRVAELRDDGRVLKDPLDVVHLKGVVKAGTGTVFTLPVGYRPTTGGCWGGLRNGSPAIICFNANGWIYQN
jgi:hypothetical protein